MGEDSKSKPYLNVYDLLKHRTVQMIVDSVDD